MIAFGDTEFCGPAAPLVSFVIPAHDRPELLRTALGSLAQLRGSVPFEVVVTDDLGLPGTAEAVRDCGIRNVRHHQNRSRPGAVANWNRGLALARGEWFSVLHEDDALYPWFLDRVVPRLRPGIAAVAVRCSRGPTPPVVALPAGPPRVRAYPPGHFLKSAISPFPGVVFPRGLLSRIGGFDERWGALADYEFWYRLATQGRVEVLRETGAFYRVGGSQWTCRAWPEMLRRAHLLRLRIAREQLPGWPRAGRWMARFFSRRNALEYRDRFGNEAAVLQHFRRFDRLPLGGLPSGWVWLMLRLLCRRTIAAERIEASAGMASTVGPPSLADGLPILQAGGDNHA